MILINPKSTKFGIFEHYVPLSVPIGLGCLAGYLLARGKRVSVIDEHVRFVTEDLLRELICQEKPPYFFGISCLTACARRTYEIVTLIRRLCPDAKIVVGGIHATVLPEEVLARDVDFVIRSEGEEPLDALYAAVENGGDISKIWGLSYKNEGRVIHNSPASLPDVSRLPPFPYHLFDSAQERYSFGFIASSRGCPYDCIFCSQRRISGQKFRYMPTSIVIDEIDLLLHKYKLTHIDFVDDSFTVNKPRVQELCEEIIRRGYHKTASFDCQTRADAINDEILILLKKAGFRVINFGLETASERLMVLLNKRETVKENVEAVKLAKKHGFEVSGTFIFGLPTETRQERWQAYRMAVDLNLDYVRFNNATPYPGTRLYEIAKEEGRLFVGEDWTNLNACATLVQDNLTEARLPYVPLGCDERELKRDVIRANIFFSLRPNRVLRLLLKRVGPAGWFYLPPRWYLKAGEWMGLWRLGRALLNSFVRSLF